MFKQGGLGKTKLTKIPLTFSASKFHLGVLELCLWGAKSIKAPRGDGTD